MLPVVEELAAHAVPISVDTSKAEVARRAIGPAPSIVNDVTALRCDPELAEVVAAGAGVHLCSCTCRESRGRCSSTRATTTSSTT